LVRSPLLAIFLIVAVDILGLTIMIPLLPFYAEKLGASPEAIGWLVGIYAACQLISGPLLGRLSDHMGRKPLLLVSQAGTFIGFLITAYAPSLWILFLARAIDGSTAGNLSLAQAYISDVTKPEDRAKSFGIIGIAFGLGFLIGPAISGFLAQFDYKYPIFAAAALSAASILSTYLLLPSVTPGGLSAALAGATAGPGGKRLTLVQWGAYLEYFRQPLLARQLWQFLSFSLGFSMFVAGMPLVLERRLMFGPKQVGYTWAFAGLMGIFLQGPALGRLVKHFGERALNRAGFVGCVGSYAMLGFVTNIPMLVAATLVGSIGGLVRPTLTSMITQATSRDEQGVVLGLTQSLTSVAMITAPPLGGLLIEHGWLTAWGLTASAIAAVGLLLSSRPATS
jgi:DHA1 family tetracycline resistance protein-like MFS transporter